MTDEDFTLQRPAAGAHSAALGNGAVLSGIVPMIFSHMADNGKLVVDGEVKNEDIARCPHALFALEHYRKDGTCRCDDPEAKEMLEWGYQWDSERGQWEA